MSNLTYSKVQEADASDTRGNNSHVDTIKYLNKKDSFLYLKL